MSKKTLNKANLTALGAERLADLLLEVSTGSADTKRRLRLELSHNLGAAELGRDVLKRLVTLRKSKGFVGWRKRKALVKDLQTQANMICDKIAPDDPKLAFDLLWDFVGLAPFIYARVDDSSGEIGDVFHAAKAGFAEIAPQALLDPDTLAMRIWDKLGDNHDGEWDGIIGLLGPSLGDAGLRRLQEFVTDFDDTPASDMGEEHAALAFLRNLRGGENGQATHKARMVKGWLQEIAAAMGDTESYVAQYTQQDLRRPDIAAEVAGLWIKQGRSDAALDLLEKAQVDVGTTGHDAWDAAYIMCLLDLGRIADAQSYRWQRFEQSLSGAHLRDYLKVLPDFEDIETEDRAMIYAQDFPQAHAALRFFLDWPDLARAARLVQDRADEWRGDLYWLLSPAVDALRTRYPLAAVILLRCMIADVLGQGRATRYGHAADHLTDCKALDADITDYGNLQPHGAYIATLKSRHNRKAAFWSQLP